MWWKNLQLFPPRSRLATIKTSGTAIMRIQDPEQSNVFIVKLILKLKEMVSAQHFLVH